MSGPEPGEVTRLLIDWAQGDEEALRELTPLVYDELCRIGRNHLKHERPDHTLQTSALVHEAYLRLVDQRHASWRNRAHFFAVAARMMRRILVDHARNRGYAKRGGMAEKVPFAEALVLPMERAPDLLALDDALSRLQSVDEQQARIVELRFFVGLDGKEIAEVLGMSTATVARRWRMVKAWLYHDLEKEDRHEG